MAKTKKKAGKAKTRGGLSMGRPKEQLVVAAFVPPSTIKLEFADSLHAQLDIHRLGIPVDMIEWHTLKVSPKGDKITVIGIKGDAAPIDSATLRYLVDAKYATEIDKSICDLHMPPAEAAESARLSKLTRDIRWNDVGDEDDLFE